MSTTNIEWTDRVWNPVTGCQKVSPGCKHCYAEGVAHRFWATQYPQVTVSTPADLDATNTLHRPRRFTDVMTHDDRLLEPLGWRKPARVFVNSMSDLFHEDVPDAFIDQVFAVMAIAEHHTFQLLTKRPERMRAYLSDEYEVRSRLLCIVNSWVDDAMEIADWLLQRGWPEVGEAGEWPLPNVWLGVSVEDQERADERIPLLLQTPATVRFISAEPLLGPVHLDNGCNSWLTCTSALTEDDYEAMSSAEQIEAGDCCESFAGSGTHFHGLDWVIVGGESGHGARPCDVAWVRSIVQQCQSADVPVFVKQMGSCITGVNLDGPPYSSPPRREGFLIHWTCRENNTFGLCNRKGGAPAEWPEDLRVREFPVAVGD